MKLNRQEWSWDVYLNSKHYHRYYSLNKAIDIAQRISGTLFGYQHVEVVEGWTGKVVYNI